MKKIIYSMLTVFLLSTFSTGFSDLALNAEITTTTNTGSIELTNTKVEEEISYIYYYWQWCSHCAKVDKYLKWVDWYNKVNLIKKEVYFDDDNRTAMLSDWKRLWLDESTIWVPFLIVNNGWVETPMIWDKTIIDHFLPTLWEVPKNNNKAIVLAILWVLAVLIPVFLIKLSNKN